jgi:hypothetical protein
MERLFDLNQWRLDQLRPEQIILIVLVLSVLIISVAVLLIILRRKSRSVRELGISLKSFREANPCFYKVMTSVLKAGKSSDLTSRGDVRAALRLLQEKTRRKKNLDRSSPLLQKDGSAKGREKAATMTILRAVYMDESLCRALPSNVVEDIDRYLDSLTG